MAAILAIPSELIMHLASFLDLKSQLHLAYAARHFYDSATRVIYTEDARSGHSYALFWSCYHGRLDTLARALATGSTINGYGPKPRLRSKFIAACRRTSGTPRSWPLEDSEQYDCPRWTPLHLAICKKSTSLVRLLVEHGASSTVAVGDPYVTALQSAAEVGLLDVLPLLASRFGSNLVNDDGRHGAPPLHYAIQSTRASDTECRSILLWLHEMGADLTFRGGRYDATLLPLACMTGKFSVALALQQLGVCPELGLTPGYLGASLLHLCVWGHDAYYREQYLLEEDDKTADPNFLSLVDKLIEAGFDLEDRCDVIMNQSGADIKHVDEYGIGAVGAVLRVAHVLEDWEAGVKMLLERGAPVSNTKDDPQVQPEGSTGVFTELIMENIDVFNQQGPSTAETVHPTLQLLLSNCSAENITLECVQNNIERCLQGEVWFLGEFLVAFARRLGWDITEDLIKRPSLSFKLANPASRDMIYKLLKVE
ncbi:ankyrin [Thozetella sp. PMI_491]|nr:ankyrin [Thozetella sp. PMI_491]